MTDINPLDVMQMKEWGIRVDEEDRERLLDQLTKASLTLTAERKRTLDVVQELQNQRNDLRDSRDTWRAWCLLLAGGMLFSIAWNCILWGR